MCNLVPDGKTIASGSADNTVRIVSSISGETVFLLEGHDVGVHHVDFSLDGQYLASASMDDNHVLLWNAKNGKLVKTLESHENCTDIHFSIDNQFFIASGQLTVTLWNSLTAYISNSNYTDIHSSIISFSLCEKDKNTFIATGHADNSVRYWQLMSLKNKPYFKLLWSSIQNTLCLQDAIIQDAKGLSASNVDLFLQRHAVGNPVPVAEASKHTTHHTTSRHSYTHTTTPTTYESDDEEESPIQPKPFLPAPTSPNPALPQEQTSQCSDLSRVYFQKIRLRH